MPKVISTLHKLKVYHILEHEAKGNEIDIGNPLENSEEVSDASIKAKSLVSSWRLENSDYPPSSNHIEYSSSLPKIQKIHSEHAELQKESKKLMIEI